MVRGACAASVGLPSDQVSKPFTICPLPRPGSPQVPPLPGLASTSCPGPVTLAVQQVRAVRRALEAPSPGHLHSCCL